MDTSSNGIAIIGMAGRFPGAENVHEFWRNLIAGAETVSFFSDEELALSRLDVAEIRRNPKSVAARGVVKDAEWFDAAFFNFGIKEAEVTDPQQRLFLEASWEALEDGGYDPSRVAGYIGVFAGQSSNSYFLNNIHPRPDLLELVGKTTITLGNEKDFLATRVAYKLNLRGPALTINTACSTSLVAVCQACHALLGYQCDLALAGGVSVSFPQKRVHYYQEGSMISHDGHCRPFDAKASGTYFSDGLGVVLLKRLPEAISDGDRIYAVIKGIGLNNDGAAKVGFTAPSVRGQAEVIALALGNAGVEPATISYVEAHGTATPLGDPIEIAALTQAFRTGTSEKNFCAIGSVKSNIGHLDAAAGVAGLIKTALALKHKTLPASLHFSQSNPQIDFANSPFFVNSKLAEWQAGATPRRAGVSAFGFGGTNAHVVLEEAPPPNDSGPSRKGQLLLLSAKTASALDTATGNLLAHLKSNPGVNLADTAFTLQAGRRAFDHRRMLVCRAVGDAIEALGTKDPRRIVTQQAKAEDCGVIFMFPGQGSQYVGMGAELYGAEPVFQAEVDQCAKILLPRLGLDLRQILFPPAGGEAAVEDLLIQTRITQPALFAIEYALAKLWMSWGVQPRAMIGHSVGEYVAGCLAGVFTLEEALGIVADRAGLVQSQPGGAMLAVRLAENELLPLLAKELSVAAINAPSLCVVSGAFDKIQELEGKLKAKDIPARRLETSHAFHSAMMDPVVGPLTDLLKAVKLKEPLIPYISNVTAKWILPAEAVDPKYWAGHVRQTVRFADGVGQLLKDTEAVLLEVGPGRALTTFASQHPAKAAGQIVLPSISASKGQELSAMLNALGRLWLAGKAIDWSGFHSSEKRQRIALPTYPFERKRFWIEPPQAVGRDAEGATIANMPPATSGAENDIVPPVPASTRREGILATIKVLFQDLSGTNAADLVPSATFLELGFDSLFLTQASLAIEKKFAVKVAFRQMLGNLSTLNDLADYLDQELPSGSNVPTPVPVASNSTPVLVTNSIQAQIQALSRQLDELRQQSAGQPAAGSVAPAATIRVNDAGKVPEPPAQPVQLQKQADVGEDGAEHEAGERLLPLSDQQKEIWLASQIETDASRAFNQVLAINLRGKADVQEVAEILERLVIRHDSLRATFAADGSGQTILPFRKFDLPSRDLSAMSRTEQEQEIRQAAAEQDQIAFDLVNGPLFRACHFKLSRERCVLIFAAHHIILDGWSIGVVLREFSQLYEAFEQGTNAALEPAMQYREYVHWRNDPAQGRAAEAAEAYWLEKYSKLPGDFEFSADRPRPAVKTYRAAEKTLLMSPSLYARIKESAAAHDCTLVAFLLAGLTAWMFRLTGEQDLVVGIPAAGQLSVSEHAGNRSLVGHCVNTLPLRSYCDGNARFSEHLKVIKDALLDAYEHQNMTLGTLARKLQLRTDASRVPLVPLVFNLGRFGRHRLTSGMEVSFFPKAFNFFDINLQLYDSGKDLQVACQYNTDLFDGARIERMLRNYETLLKAAAAKPSQKVSNLPLLTNSERHQILVEWNWTATDYPKEWCLHELVEDQARRTPEATALVFEDKQLTYRELDSRANQLACRLQSLGVGPDVLTGICMERSLEMVVGLLGILKAGGAYVPMDPEYPKERLAFMVEDSAVTVLLTQGHLTGTLPASSARVMRLDADWAEIARESAEPVESGVGPGNLAYMIYTSGSTGRPKGAMNTHQGIVNRLLWMQEEYRLSHGDRVMQKTPFSFDVSVWEFFWPLLTGARLVMARPGGHRDGAYLRQLIAQEKITTLHFVPSMLQVFLEQEGLGASCSSLKRVICSGEALPMELQRRFYAVMGAELHNLYGPTEASVDVTYWACDRNSPLSFVPIGKPIANTQIYILDGQLEPVPIGVPGELHIGGIGVARGYHHRPELTAEKFIADPFSREAGARLYKTGDLARYLPDGNIEYLGRLDYQVKIRGSRVELGEIEEAMNRHPGIQTSVVMAWEVTPGDKRLVAYLVNRNGSVSSSELREYLRDKLPDYMVPAAFVTLKDLPLSPNGKVDRKALPKPELESVAAEFTPPDGNREIALANIWCEVLGLKQIGVNDNFFDLGGNSLLAIRLTEEMNKILHRDLRIPDLFQNPTIKKLAWNLEHRVQAKTEPAIYHIKKGVKGPPVFFIGAGYWPGYLEHTLAWQLGEQWSVFATEAPLSIREIYAAATDRWAPFIKVEEMAAAHVPLIAGQNPSAPCVLAGYSYGGILAFEVAHQLQRAGIEVEAVYLLDTWLTSPSRWWRFKVWFDQYLKNTPSEMLKRLRNRASKLMLRWMPGLRKSIAWPINVGNLDEIAELPWGIAALAVDRALRVYRRRPLGSRGVVFRTQEGNPYRGYDSGVAAKNLFKKGLSIVDVPGNHYNMSQIAHLQVLARKFEESLEQLSGDEPHRAISPAHKEAQLASLVH